MSHIKVCSVDEDGRFGGPQRRVIEIAKAIKQYDIDTHVVYPIYNSERFSRELFKSRILSTSLKITRLTKEKKVLAKYIFTFFSDILRLYSFFKKRRFDLVQVNSTSQYKGVLAAKMAGIPVIWVFEDTRMPLIIKKICIILAKYLAAGIIVTGKKVYDYYIHGSMLKNKLCAEIHAPVDTNIFDPSHVAPDKRMKHIRGRKIVTVSGISPVKGFEYFVEMASELLQRYDDLAFFVAGTELSSQKKYSHDIKNLIASTKLTSDNYFFYGMIDDVPSFLQGADIFVHTSISEAGPVTVWEAMSMGKAIVTTDVGSVRQYIEDGISGFIVPIMDSKALSIKVEELLNDPALRKRMGTEARKVAKKKLNVSIAADKYILFYKKVLRKSYAKKKNVSDMY